jgi:DNA-binding GntR family transcriptional regulator
LTQAQRRDYSRFTNRDSDLFSASKAGSIRDSRPPLPRSDVTPLQPEKSSLAESVHARIRADIYDFRMMPGDRHSESELATRYGVSRTPLRLALHMLAREGYLNKGDGHAAWQVRPLDLDYFQDLYDLRVNLELIAIRRICKSDPFPDFSAQRDFWLVAEERRNLDGAAVARADEALHAALVANAGNAEMARVHRDITERIRVIRRLDFIEEARIVAAYEEHARLLRALFARKQERAEMLLKAHIDASRAEIRHLTLHRLAEAGRQRSQPFIPAQGKP